MWSDQSVSQTVLLLAVSPRILKSAYSEQLIYKPLESLHQPLGKIARHTLSFDVAENFVLNLLHESMDTRLFQMTTNLSLHAAGRPAPLPHFKLVVAT